MDDLGHVGVPAAVGGIGVAPHRHSPADLVVAFVGRCARLLEDDPAVHGERALDAAGAGSHQVDRRLAVACGLRQDAAGAPVGRTPGFRMLLKRPPGQRDQGRQDEDDAQKERHAGDDGSKKKPLLCYGRETRCGHSNPSLMVFACPIQSSSRSCAARWSRAATAARSCVIDGDGADGAEHRRRRTSRLSALGRQGHPGAAADRERRGRRARLRQPGTRARLRLARRRAGACRAGLFDAGQGRARRFGAGMRHALAVEPQGDDRRSRAQAASRTPCTTTARASIPGSSAPAVHVGIDHRGYVNAGHPFQEMVRETMQEVTGALTRPMTAASTAARSRPMRCR